MSDFVFVLTLYLGMVGGVGLLLYVAGWMISAGVWLWRQARRDNATTEK